MDHNEDDLGVQSPEQIPLPDSEDELGAASSAVADDIQPAEESLGTNHPKRVKKLSHKVIENKLVEIENQLEIQWMLLKRETGSGERKSGNELSCQRKPPQKSKMAG